MKKIYLAGCLIFLCIIVVTTFVIHNYSVKGTPEEKTEKNHVTTLDDTVRINIQPLDGIKSVGKDAEQLTELYLKPLGFKNLKVTVLPHKNSPDSVYNDSHTRYRAMKIMNFLHDNTPQKEFTIGITDKDVSTSIHGVSDYGILGISSLGHRKRACITSTYRLKYRTDLWKLMAHEFTHGFFNQRHCKMDNERCIMKDAKGKSPKFEIKEELCKECRADIAHKIN